MTLTRDQIEAIRDRRGGLNAPWWLPPSIAPDAGDDPELTASAVAHNIEFAALCTLALQALDMQWRPIEEAPKDGRSFIAASFVHQRIEFISVVEWRNANSDDEFSCWWDTQADDASGATHFIPPSALPAPEAAS